MKKGKTISIIIAAILGIFSLNLLPMANHAYAVDIKSVCNDDVAEEIRKANGCPNAGETMKLSDVIIGILNGVIGILGLVAVIFIIVGGVNYMTSAGDVGKVQKAKNTILYAVIGLVIAVLSFAIVNFVVGNILGGEVSDDNDDDTNSSQQTTNSGGGPTNSSSNSGNSSTPVSGGGPNP